MSPVMSEIYDQAVKNLAASERLELASLLLRSIPPQSVVDYSEQWSDEDLKEFAASCAQQTLNAIERDETRDA